MNTSKIPYEKIGNADLYVDAIYCSPRPRKGGYSDDVLTVMLHNCRNTGGFRVPHRKDRTVPYIGLHLCDFEPSWPDFFDVETGLLTYFGDNRTGGTDVEKTPIGGNKLMREMFDNLSKGNQHLKCIPPIFVFQNTGECRDVRFLGLAVPGVKDIHSDAFFSTVWRSKGNIRFPNYKAVFTILDLKGECIQRKWIDALFSGNPKDIIMYAPKEWLKFQKGGLDVVKPLEARREVIYPGKDSMLPDNAEDWKILLAIHKRYGKNNPTGFEKLSARLLYLMDSNYSNVTVTRPTKDGGRDALGLYMIKSPSESIAVECAMESKCYNPKNKGVGVRETSRLISRIRNRQFGIMVTTSYINKPAYMEIKEDNHPILFCTGRDIVRLLKEKENVTSSNINDWLDNNIDKV